MGLKSLFFQNWEKRGKPTPLAGHLDSMRTSINLISVGVHYGYLYFIGYGYYLSIVSFFEHPPAGNLFLTVLDR